MQVGTPRAKDNAQKALEMLATQVVQEEGSPKNIPPTSPVDHSIWSKYGRKKVKKTESIRIDASGSTSHAPNSPSYHALDDLD